MGLFQHHVLDIRGQNSKAVQQMSLPKPTAFLACEENHDEIHARLAVIKAWQDSDALQ